MLSGEEFWGCVVGGPNHNMFLLSLPHFELEWNSNRTVKEFLYYWITIHSASHFWAQKNSMEGFDIISFSFIASSFFLPLFWMTILYWSLFW